MNKITKIYIRSKNDKIRVAIDRGDKRNVYYPCQAFLDSLEIALKCCKQIERFYAHLFTDEILLIYEMKE